MTHCFLLKRVGWHYDSPMVRSLTLALAMAWSICSVCRAEHAVFTRPSPAPQGLFFFLRQDDRIDAHLFSSRDYMLQVLDEGDSGTQQGGTLAEAMRRSGCAAGVNGGYFAADATHTPLGLLRHRGKSITRLATQGFTVAGVLYDTGEKLLLERSHTLSAPIERMQEAIQGGPFLVEQGRLVPGLDRQKAARRTFVATDGKGNWCLAVSSPMSLHQLAEWLATPGAMGAFTVRHALNLDGGTSSAYWDGTDGTYLPSFKPVRNYVGIKPRPAPKADTASPDNTKPATRKAKRASRK